MPTHRTKATQNNRLPTRPRLPKPTKGCFQDLEIPREPTHVRAVNPIRSVSDPGGKKKTNQP
ncbi:hypothetical protein PGTUg99_035018 [Puccinia graminis f. sp. tritici]|uniref:Uncharacterized protein n=1 Tax=Puccinia graminis f. sp. tritici TaxID=56615 RepID=A0A5B0MHP4_PUCGR|nr:hypothetical protein PGTUg99_035018 [Puccinia graminis f. sp. tritici]